MAVFDVVHDMLCSGALPPISMSTSICQHTQRVHRLHLFIMCACVCVRFISVRHGALLTAAVEQARPTPQCNQTGINMPNARIFYMHISMLFRSCSAATSEIVRAGCRWLCGCAHKKPNHYVHTCMCVYVCDRMRSVVI